jgi:glyoxylase-like metal-dependent hydrolase (beta-lactamase superfamily II)
LRANDAVNDPGVFPSELVSQDPLLVMFTAPNPGPKTLEGTHTFVVGMEQTYVIDPGPDIPAYTDFLATRLTDHGHAVQGILLSHGHPDHAPGAARLAQLLGAPVWGSPQLTGLALDHAFEDGQSFAIDGDRLRAVFTPGHASDHIAFWLERARILFSGDTILGRGSTLVAPPEGDMIAYLGSLEVMRRLRPRLIAPGHGPIVQNPEAKIAEYLEHRRQREQQILAALGQGPATDRQLVERIYVDTDPRLLPLALGSVQAQLAKLLAEGRVRRSGDDYVLQ